MKTSKNVVKSRFFWKLLWWRVQKFFEVKKECNVSCVKIIAWLKVVKEGTNTLIFYIFVDGAEFSAESGAK